MANKVFTFNYPNSQLPETNDGIIEWAERETGRLTGNAATRVIHFVEVNTMEPEHRLTISVPEEDAEALDALKSNGAEPQFEEPSQPYHTDNDEIVLPGSFQAIKFGHWLDPRSIQDNPMRLTLLAQEINEAIPDLPPEAKDWSNWDGMENDEDDGTFTIYWRARDSNAPEDEESLTIYWREPTRNTPDPQ